MKLVSFRFQDGSTHLGVRLPSPSGSDASSPGQILDLTRAAPSSAWSRDVLKFIEHSDTALSEAKALIEKVRAGKIDPKLLTDEVSTHLLSPIPRPVSLRDGYAFRQHVESSRKNRGLPMMEEFDHFPVFYYGNHLTVEGPGEVRVWDKALNKCDFELEAAVVIGNQGRNIPASKADDHIFGYMVMNDWSARAIWLEHEAKIGLGPAKAKDFCTTLGPYLVTRDELSSHRIPSPKGELFDLNMTAHVNGIQVSKGNLKDMSWTFAQIIEHASRGVTLYPGEVIGSGTVGTGCFYELNLSKATDNQWLRPGDEVVLEIEGLGRLSNRVVADSER